MSRFSKLFAANTIAVAGLGAMAIAASASAAAEPAVQPAVPGVPALSMIQEFATNPASVGAVLQTAATALNGVSTAVGAPAPNTLPVSPIDVGPSTAIAPTAPATPVTPTGPAQTLVPLLNQLGVPANLVNLAPTNLLPIGTATPAPVAAPAPVAPVAPAAPAAAAINPLPLLTALP